MLNGEESFNAVFIVSTHELNNSLHEFHNDSQLRVFLDSGDQVEGLVDVTLVDPDHQQQLIESSGIRRIGNPLVDNAQRFREFAFIERFGTQLVMGISSHIVEVLVLSLALRIDL